MGYGPPGTIGDIVTIGYGVAVIVPVDPEAGRCLQFTLDEKKITLDMDDETPGYESIEFDMAESKITLLMEAC